MKLRKILAAGLLALSLATSTTAHAAIPMSDPSCVTGLANVSVPQLKSAIKKQSVILKDGKTYKVKAGEESCLAFVYVDKAGKYKITFDNIQCKSNAPESKQIVGFTGIKMDGTFFNFIEGEQVVFLTPKKAFDNNPRAALHTSLNIDMEHLPQNYCSCFIIQCTTAVKGMTFDFHMKKVS